MKSRVAKMQSKLAVVEKGSARKDHSSRIKARVFPFRLSMHLINSECVFSQAHSVALIKSEETPCLFVFFASARECVRNLLRDDSLDTFTGDIFSRK